MPFVKISGLTGKVYVPQQKPGEARKHPCRDCFACQMCSDERCKVCRETKSPCSCKKTNCGRSD